MAEPIRVLYVDDEKPLLDVGKLFLEEYGDFTVTTAGSAPEGLRLLGQEKFDAIISDYLMPGMDGIRFLVEVRSRFGQIPFILFTGRGREEVVIQAINSGADFYLQKGGEPEALFAELAHKVRSAALRKKGDHLLRDEQQFSKSVLDSLPGIFYLYTYPECRLVLWNRQHETIFGFTPGEMKDRHVTDWHAPETRDAVMKAIETVMETGHSSMDAVLLAKDGRPVPFFLTGVRFEAHDRSYFMGIGIDISERKRSEQMQISAQQRLREAHRLAHIGTWDWVIETDTVTWSEGLYTIAGWDPSLPAPTYAELPRFYTPASWEQLSAAVTRALTTGEPYDLELEMVRPDGSMRWTHASGGTERDGKGKIVGLHGTVQDITRQKNAEKILRDSEEKYRNIFAAAKDAVFLVDIKTGSILEANDTATRMFGYSQEELSGLKSTDISAEPGNTWKSMQEGQNRVPLRYMKKKDGTIFPVEISVSKFVLRDRNVLLAVLHDITGRKKAEDALLETNELFSQFMRHSPIYAYIKDVTPTESRVIQASDNYTEMIGISGSDMVGKTMEELFPTELAAKMSADDWAVVKTGKLLSLEEHLNDRSYFSIKFPIVQGGKNLLAGYTIDITERKQAEQLLRESEEKHRAIIENIQDMVYRTDMNGKFTMVSPSGARLVGLESPDQLIGRDAAERYENPDDRKAFLKALTQNGSVYGYPITLKAVDGTIHHVTSSSHFFYDADGVAQGVEGVIHDITDLRRAEDALKQSEERFRQMFQLHAATMLLIDPENGAIIDANHAAARFYGYSQEQLRTMNITDINTLSKEQVQEEYTNAAREARNDFIFPHKLANGEIRMVEVHSTPITIKQQTVLFSIIHNITERKRAEEALRKSKNQYDNLVTRIPVGIYSMRSTQEGSFSFDYISPRLAEMFDVSAERALADPMAGLAPIHPDDLKALVTLNREKFNRERSCGPQPFAWDGRITVHGETKWIHIEASPEPLENGDVVWNGIVSDITGRKKYEDLLKTRDRIFNHALDMLCIAGFDGYFKTLNPAWSKTLGWSTDELLAKTWIEFVHPEDRESTAQVKSSIVDGQIVYQFENRYICKDGSVKWLSWNSFPYPDEQIMFGVARDITRRKQEEEALRKVSKKLALLSGITRHDLKNQLLSLNAYLGISKKSLGDTAKLSEFITKEEQIVRTMERQIAFTKEYESVGVHAPVWQDCRTLVDTAATQAPLGQIIVKNDLPAGAEVFADPMVVRVFYNLMDNAARYGGKIATIRFAVEEAGDNHIIVCQDDGEGVTADEKEMIFERGFGRNTGLGLSLSREILDITGIAIRETGTPGTGARFEITVPKELYRSPNPQ